MQQKTRSIKNGFKIKTIFITLEILTSTLYVLSLECSEGVTTF
nr:MAG TPA: hypothetical protein [Caudoviricetes sp.]